MVCFACNGKGYVRIDDHELPCFECQGRGELLLTDDEFSQPPESAHYTYEPSYERVGFGD